MAVRVLALTERSSLVLALTMLVPDWDVDAVGTEDEVVDRAGSFDVLVVEAPVTAAGVAVAERLAEIGMRAPAVVVGDVPQEHPDVAVLVRPFTVADLCERIAGLLGVPQVTREEPDEPPTKRRSLLRGRRGASAPDARSPVGDAVSGRDDGPVHPAADLDEALDPPVEVSIERLIDEAPPVDDEPEEAAEPEPVEAEHVEPELVEPEPVEAEPVEAELVEPELERTASDEVPPSAGLDRLPPAPPTSAPLFHIDAAEVTADGRPDPFLLPSPTDAAEDDDGVVVVLGGYERPLVPPPEERVTDAPAEVADDVIVIPEADTPEPATSTADARPAGAEPPTRALLAELVNAFDPVTAAVWVRDDTGRWRVVDHLGLRAAEAKRAVEPEQPMFAAVAANLHGVLLSPADLARGYLAGVPGTWTEDVMAAAVGLRRRCLAIVVVGGDGLTERSTRRLVALAADAAPALAPFDPDHPAVVPGRRRRLMLGRR